MKSSCAHLIALLSLVSVAFVAAEDVAAGKAGEVDNKWFGGRRGWLYGTGAWNMGWGSNYMNSYSWLGNYYNSGCYGLGFYNNYYPGSWFKSVDGQQQRRSIDLHPQPILTERATASVECKNQEGKSQAFSNDSCTKAVDKLVNQKTSTATCDECSLTLVGPSGKLSPAGIPTSELHNAVQNILKACSSGTTDKPLSASELARRSPAEQTSNSHESSGSAKPGFAVLLSKGQGPACH